MEKVLQEKLVAGILGIFKDASEKVTKGETQEDKDVEKAKIAKEVADKAAAEKAKLEKDKTPEGITGAQMLEGLAKMGENIVTAVKEAVKTPEQRSQENKVVAVDAVKQYLTQEGFDLKDQSIDITFAETKKGGGIQDGDSLELKLVKNGTEIKKSGDNADDTENQFKSVDDIPEDVQEAANKAIWKEMLK